MFSQWQIDFYQILYRLVAWFYRAPIFQAILHVNAQPINYVNDKFVAFKNAIDYMLKFNAQIVYLEKFLNDMFTIPYDPATRVADIASVTIIYITSDNSFPNFFWNKREARPAVYLFNKSEGAPPFYVGNASEYLASNSFVIHVPHTIFYNPLNIRNAVNTYNLASKTFSIVNYH